MVKLKFFLNSFFLLFAGVVFSQVNHPLQMGIGVVNITTDTSTVLDPLHVKGIVFKQGAEQFALVECDIISIPNDIVSIRKKAAQTIGIPYNNITVSATHNHMAGSYKDISLAIVEALSKAKADLKPVTLRSGVGQQFNVSFNRRYFMKDGSVVFNPMFLNPEIVRPAGTIDPDVGLVMFYNATTNKPVSALTNFAMHLDVVKEYGSVYQNTGAGSRNSVSADYPYWLEENFRKDYGKDFTSIFLTGCCGNINHWDFSKPGPQSGHKTKSKEIGDSLYSSIKRELPKLKAENANLGSRYKIVNVPLQAYTEADLNWARNLDKKSLSSRSEEPNDRKKFLDDVRRRRYMALESYKREGKGNTVALDVQVFRLTDNTAIVTLPGEMFVEFGMNIKNNSPFENTIVVEMSNNSIAYVPTKKAFLQGGYEVENSRIAAGGGEMLANAAIQMLNELKVGINN
ncbi:MAG TPA: hypothetical protein VNI52_14675 [Sphingobacteriaceae bacterium]|nr:hypothetical protein [Sphingobacteriaceae bacterium]